MEIICILGPESSGKTTLAQQIAHNRNAIYIPEYARLYTEMLLKHQREYTYNDICRIAMHQMDEWEKLFGEDSEDYDYRGDGETRRSRETRSSRGSRESRGTRESREDEGVSQNRCVVLDTEWIITQVWFEEVYGQTPNGWHLPKHYTQAQFLLTAPDIAWVDDPVRENGSDEKRWYLFERYEDWLRKIGAKYEIVRHKAKRE